MKKLLFILICFIALTPTAHAQTDDKFKPVSTVIVCPPPVRVEDDQRIEQQFLRDLNGIEYRIIIEEHPFNVSRNCIRVYQHDTKKIQDIPVSFSCFALPAYYDDLSILPTGDDKTITISYMYNGKKKIIEIK